MSRMPLQKDFKTATIEQRAEFLKNEYVLIKGFFTPAQAALFCAHAEKMGEHAEYLLGLANDAARSPGELARRLVHDLIVVPESDDPEKLCRFEYLMGANPDFSHLVQGLITPAISDLMGERYAPFKDKLNLKAPGGGAFTPHQDFTAYQSFGPRYNVTAMISIDHATTQNGCLQFAQNFGELIKNPDVVKEWVHDIRTSDDEAAPGHRPILHWYQGGPTHGDIRDDIVAQIDWKSIETGPQDLVIFSSFTPHYSEPNASGHFRRAIFLTHAPLRAGEWYRQYYTDKRTNYLDPKFHVSTPTLHAASQDIAQPE